MDMEFEKTLAILGGQSADAFIKSQLSDTDKAQIDSAIDLMFSGLSLHNWLAGGTLGNAWSGALDTVREYVFSFMENNPATNYARTATFAHRRKWHVQIVSSIHANDTIRCPSDKFSAWQDDANAKIQDGAEMLRAKIAEFASKPAVRRLPQTINPIVRDAIKSRTIGEREHEHEHVREY